jgi:N-methylhydantoinase B
MLGFLFSGLNPENGDFFASGADEACGAGASIEADGENGLIVSCLAAAQNVPIEVLEERYPVTVLKYGFRQDSGGAGKYRGGLGVEKFYRAESELSLVWIAEQSKSPAWGLFGGGSALPNLAITNPGTEREKQITKVAGHKIPKGEQWHVRTGGGGGWGNPYDRKSEDVLLDIIRGYVSVESAKRDYGVAVLKSADGYYVVDKDATDNLRGSASE